MSVIGDGNGCRSEADARHPVEAAGRAGPDHAVAGLESGVHEVTRETLARTVRREAAVVELGDTRAVRADPERAFAILAERVDDVSHSLRGAEELEPPFGEAREPPSVRPDPEGSDAVLENRRDARGSDRRERR